jgi:hypothetical protein
VNELEKIIDDEVQLVFASQILKQETILTATFARRCNGAPQQLIDEIFE